VIFVEAKQTYWCIYNGTWD